MLRSGAPMKRMLFACVPALIAGLPLLSWAQGSAPPTPPAAKDSAKTAAPAASEFKGPILPDSVRRALRTRVDRQIREMADSLRLTPEQRAQAKQIMLDHASRVMMLTEKYAMRESAPEAVEAMQKEMKVLRDGNDARLATVLTAEQMTHYKRMRDHALARERAQMGWTTAPAAAAPTPRRGRYDGTVHAGSRRQRGEEVGANRRRRSASSPPWASSFI